LYPWLFQLIWIGLLVSLTQPIFAADHWSLRPRTHPAVPVLPQAKGTPWGRNPIDAFIAVKLRQAGLQPAPKADRATLIRRLTFDLTGLPPTPEAVMAFVNDPAADAYEKLVERLLASPQYGEHWGRHWLDVVRYAESEGFEYDRFRPGAWRYRDYVIQSFNMDKPFDCFLLEQLAGDEFGPKDPDCLVAAGFHRLGPVRRNAGNQKVAANRHEVLNERTDAIGAAFLGLTIACARCHNHRFDDIPQKDYFRLQAYLAAAQEHDLVLADARTQAAWKTAADKIQQQIKQLQKKLEGRIGPAARDLEAKIAALTRALPEPLPTISTIQNSAGQRTPIHVLKRGDIARPGALVGPRPLSVLLTPETPELPADIANPRTLLAKWLNDPDHPLVPRVLVNRLWHYHFGRGLVATPNDFGINGSAPSHPELLDWLANEFVANGRRLKPIHRRIVLSSAYRQASRAVDPARSQRIDPENRLLSHFPRRRLSAEEIRDAMLAVAGQLNLKAGGPSVMVPVEKELVNLLYDPAQWVVTPNAGEHRRRSVYMTVKRNLQLPFAQVFDQPDSQISCPRRESSTHALQTLELLNGTLSNSLAKALAQRLERECGSDRGRQVDRVFWLVAGRAPTVRERELSTEFLKTQSVREFALALFNLNAFLYVE
jgi:hypothetical protein